jgi:electron-transferring-flavoprotein dehydrogenase
MQQLIRKLNLREEVGAEHQTYALGLKEVWQVDSSKHKEGLVEHLVGYPLDSWTFGGAFIYHMADNKVQVGFVVALDYWNTYLNPYQEFQRFKSHKYVRRLLEGGECLEYGSRALNEGALLECEQNSCAFIALCSSVRVSVYEDMQHAADLSVASGSCASG